MVVALSVPLVLVIVFFVMSLIASCKREHSRKPDELYPIIEACSRGPFLEHFARERRPGWASWGLEVDWPMVPIAAESER
jgi:N6-adenosine-specific RNA methylase IME4